MSSYRQVVVVEVVMGNGVGGMTPYLVIVIVALTFPHCGTDRHFSGQTCVDTKHLSKLLARDHLGKTVVQVVYKPTSVSLKYEIFIVLEMGLAEVRVHYIK